MGDDETAAARADWRILVAQGRAGLSGSTLYPTSPGMSEAAWMARHLTEH